MKVRVSISIDQFIYEKAQEQLRGRISAICEKSLYQAINGAITDDDNKKICANCKAQNVDMVWYVDEYEEKWLCTKCNNRIIRNIPVAMLAHR